VCDDDGGGGNGASANRASVELSKYRDAAGDTAQQPPLELARSYCLRLLYESVAPNQPAVIHYFYQQPPISPLYYYALVDTL
jgi:hypothetical protein